MRILSGRLFLLLAAVLMGMAVVEKPSMLLLCVTPKGMAATVTRLFMGLLAAVGIRTCLSGMIRGSRRRTRGNWKTVFAFSMMIALVVLVCAMLGTGAFMGLRPGSLVANRAYMTQLVAFTLLWLGLLM